MISYNSIHSTINDIIWCFLNENLTKKKDMKYAEKNNAKKKHFTFKVH